MFDYSLRSSLSNIEYQKSADYCQGHRERYKLLIWLLDICNPLSNERHMNLLLIFINNYMGSLSCTMIAINDDIDKLYT